MAHQGVNDPDKLKHRHDVGHPDHGPHNTTSVTRTIQGLLAAAIAGTVALTVYALVVAGTA